MKKKIILLILSIVVVLTILGSSTYSLLFKENETSLQSYETGILSITSNKSSDSVTLTDSLPVEDSVGEVSDPYTFTITNNGNLSYQFDVKLLNQVNTNQIDSQYIKVKVNDNAPVSLSSLTERKILENIILTPGNSISITIRVWLDINTPNTQIGKYFNGKIVTSGQAVMLTESYLTLLNLGLDDLLNEGTPTFSNVAITDEGIYAAEDDLGTSYYFRGASERNYVKFGENASGQDMYWRIIRINGDGSIRMIYAGTSVDGIDVVTNIEFNANATSNGHVGYMYGSTLGSSYALEHSNNINSTIKTFLEGEPLSTNTGWYYENIIATGYDEFIADAIYCNDRSLDSEFNTNSSGYSDIFTEYAPYERLYGDKHPSLKCANSNDRFTNSIDDFSIETNGKLKYPVGLITGDEVIMAGGGSYGSLTYLNKYIEYWTMSPTYVENDLYMVVNNFVVGSSDGSFYGQYVDVSKGVAPVISLKADTPLVGSGTMTEPFSLPSASYLTLMKLGLDGLLNEGTPDFSTVATTDEGIYAAEDDLGTSYYFRGTSTKNYVKFGKNSSNQDMYWRIIRINGDGSVRLIYDGTSPGEGGVVETSVAFSSDISYNGYVGYMHGSMVGMSYGYDYEHANEVNSVIKTYLEGEISDETGWYYENIVVGEYDEYVVDAIYCNDRSLVSGTGDSTNMTDYGSFFRFINKTPKLTCALANDRFTNDSDNFEIDTNGKLKYPVGLITADELMMAGAAHGNTNASYYLKKNYDYWTMSPAYYSGGFSREYYSISNGSVSYEYSGVGKAVVPVISIASDVLEYSSTSNGTISYPFVLAS